MICDMVTWHAVFPFSRYDYQCGHRRIWLIEMRYVDYIFFRFLCVVDRLVDYAGKISVLNGWSSSFHSSLPHPSNAERQTRKQQVSILKLLVWLNQFLNPRGSDCQISHNGGRSTHLANASGLKLYFLLHKFYINSTWIHTPNKELRFDKDYTYCAKYPCWKSTWVIWNTRSVSF